MVYKGTLRNLSLLSLEKAGSSQGVYSLRPPAGCGKDRLSPGMHCKIARLWPQVIIIEVSGGIRTSQPG